MGGRVVLVAAVIARSFSKRAPRGVFASSPKGICEFVTPVVSSVAFLVAAVRFLKCDP